MIQMEGLIPLMLAKAHRIIVLWYEACKQVSYIAHMSSSLQ